jgi:heptosyltransferase I
MPAQPKNIAFFRLSALGDVVLAIPMLRALQKAWPDCKITWITSSAVYPLLEGLEGIEFLVINKPRTIKDYLALRQQFKQYSFDILIAAQASFRANLIYPHINAKRKIGFDNGRAKDLHSFFVNEQIAPKDEHLAEGFMGFATHLGIESPEYDWHLFVNDEDKSWASEQRAGAKKYIAINAAASKVERTWSAQNYSDLINAAVKKYDCQFVLTGGPAANEVALAAQIETLTTSHVTNLVGKTKHKQIAALLGEVDCLIAPDTGPAHIAVAMHTPVIGLYAVARSGLSGPYQVPNYTVDKYPQAVNAFLGKDVKKSGWHERVHHKDAMDLIKVEDVLKQLDKVLAFN